MNRRINDSTAEAIGRFAEALGGERIWVNDVASDIVEVRSTRLKEVEETCRSASL